MGAPLTAEDLAAIKGLFAHYAYCSDERGYLSGQGAYLLAEVERLRAREVALREALRFYADPETYRERPTGEQMPTWSAGWVDITWRPIDQDEGEQARALLDPPAS